MGLKSIFGLKDKKAKKENELTKLEKDPINSISTSIITSSNYKETDENGNSENTLSELDELSRQELYSDMDLGLDPITEKLTGASKNSFNSGKKTRRKGGFLDDVLNPNTDEDVGLGNFDHNKAVPLTFKNEEKINNINTDINTDGIDLEKLRELKELSLGELGGTIPNKILEQKVEQKKSTNLLQNDQLINNTPQNLDKKEKKAKVKINNDLPLDSLSKNAEENHYFATDSLKNLDLKSNNISNDIFSDSIGVEINQKKLPIIGDLPAHKQYQIAGVLAIVSFLGIILGGFLYGNSTTKEAKVLQSSAEFMYDTQKINTFFREATLGKNQAYDNLVKIAGKTKSDFEIMKKNINSTNTNNELTAIQPKVQDYLYKIDSNIELLRLQADVLMNSSEKVADFNKNVNELSIEIDKFISLYSQLSLNQNELSNVYSLKTNLQMVNGNLATILLSDKIEQSLIDNLNKGKTGFKNTLISLQTGDVTHGINQITSPTLLDAYQRIAKEWIKLTVKADAVITKSNELIQARDLAPRNEELVNLINKNVTDITNIYRNEDLTGANLAKATIAISTLLLMLAIITTFSIYSLEKDNRSLFEKIENNKKEASILKLLTEMIPLQEGNLTKKTTVTVEMTGAIADSINATIDSLSSLVKKIKDTSLVMREKTNEVNVISMEMLKVNENQVSSLNQTGNSVIKIVDAISDISTKTEKGAEEARKSVKVSEEGAKQVLESVKAMEAINENMNETVLLMQKVNDSSTQISSIVELLSDITEETSILALNATVQAAKAGDAGKGFKIVADSIQELANTASDAARRVGALISTVQTDVQAVENAVKKTTQQVEKGVQLSALAGKSLNNMTHVSNELSQIVRVISEETKFHASSAKHISESMTEILKTTEENKLSTEKTAHSIYEISEISNELEESVRSFTVE